MTDLEMRLEQALAADAAPARDPMFRIAVMLRRQRAASRQRLLAGAALAFGVAIIGTLGLAATEALQDGGARLAALSAIGVALAALTAAPHLGGAAALRGLMARASSALRTLPGLRLWP